MMRYLLGLDMGTTAVKAALFDDQKTLIASDVCDYQLLTPEKDRIEFPAEQYWEALCAISRSVIRKAGVSKETVAALALSCQGETLICLDEQGRPLQNAIVWLDNRAVAEAEELKQVFTRKQVYETTGQADMIATWPASKILWLKRNAPERFKKTAKYLLLADYLVYRMTGAFAGEPNLWASSALLNIHTNAWWQEMLDAIGVDAGQLPRIVPCGTAIGFMLPQAVEKMGVSSACRVVAGALDQTCNTIGCGMTKAGSILETTGSCLAVSAITTRFIPYREDMRLTCQNSAVPGRYTVLLWSQSAGMTHKWFAKNFYSEAKSQKEAFEMITRDAEAIPPGCDGLIMLPHLTGAANPEYDSSATGVFAGMTLKHTRAHFGRAVMEAVACMLRRDLDQLAALGIDNQLIYSAGGGAESGFWLQIKADLAQRSFQPLRARDSACLGAAILAGAGVGIFDGVDGEPQACSQAVHTPDTQNARQYEMVYQKYIRLYDALKPYFAYCGNR